MSAKPQTEVIIVHETILKSVVVDATAFALFLSLIGVGWFLNSNAMQWVGAIIGFITIVAQSSVRTKRCTIAQARKKLDELESGR